jgi:hypothetical protein
MGTAATERDDNVICVVCCSGAATEEEGVLQRFRDLLSLPGSANTLELSTRYYSPITVAIQSVVWWPGRNRGSSSSSEGQEKEQTSAAAELLRRCGVVVLFADDIRACDALAQAQNAWMSICDRLDDDCVRLLVIDGGGVQQQQRTAAAQCGVVPDRALERLLRWAADARIELVCEEVCDEGVTVAGRTWDALQCASAWLPARRTAPSAPSVPPPPPEGVVPEGMGRQEQREQIPATASNKGRTADEEEEDIAFGTRNAWGCAPQRINDDEEDEETKTSVALAGNRVRKPLLRADVDMLTQTLLALGDCSSDEDDGG